MKNPTKTLEERELEANEQLNLEKLYTKKLNDIFYSQGIAKMNKLVGLNSKSQFSLGLFLKLGINFDFVKLDHKEEFNRPEKIDHSNKDEIISTILGNLKAYVIASELEKNPMVHMKFSYYDEDDMKDIINCVFNDKNDIGISFLTFVYFHEVQHLLRRHNTSIFNNIMLRTAQTFDDTLYTEYTNELHKLCNMAEDYCINNAIAELFEKSGGSFLMDIQTISKFGLFDKKYTNHNETEVLIILLKQQPTTTVISEDEHSITLSIQNKDEDGNDKGDPITITIPKQGGQGQGDAEEKEEGSQKMDGKSIEQANAIDQSINAVADSIENHIDTQKEKGEGNFLLNEDIGTSIKTNIDWFDKLKSNFFTIVNRKTRQTLVNWSKLNNKYTHSHKSPTHRNIENTLNIYLSVDNSGSMSNDSLRKLLYIIEQKSSKINNITILKHTDTISGTLENETNPSAILDFLSKRDSGGTSHKDVFNYLDTNIPKKDVDKSIFISFSDNYSDIESQYHNFKNIRKISKVWLNSDGIAVRDEIPGLKIDIF